MADDRWLEEERESLKSTIESSNANHVQSGQPLDTALQSALEKVKRLEARVEELQAALESASGNSAQSDQTVQTATALQEPKSSLEVANEESSSPDKTRLDQPWQSAMGKNEGLDTIAKKLEDELESTSDNSAWSDHMLQSTAASAAQAEAFEGGEIEDKLECAGDDQSDQEPGEQADRSSPDFSYRAQSDQQLRSAFERNGALEAKAKDLEAVLETKLKQLATMLESAVLTTVCSTHASVPILLPYLTFPLPPACYLSPLHQFYYESVD